MSPGGWSPQLPYKPSCVHFTGQDKSVGGVGITETCILMITISSNWKREVHWRRQQPPYLPLIWWNASDRNRRSSASNLYSRLFAPAGNKELPRVLPLPFLFHFCRGNSTFLGEFPPPGEMLRINTVCQWLTSTWSLSCQFCQLDHTTSDRQALRWFTSSNERAAIYWLWLHGRCWKISTVLIENI